MTLAIVIHLGLFAWWSLSVMIIIKAFNELGTDGWRVALAAPLWPILSPFILVAGMWRLFFKSTKTIRVDLANRKLMKEFDEFMDRRDD